MNVYRAGVIIYGTLYIKAASKGQARRIAAQLKGKVLDGCDFDDPELPNISLCHSVRLGAPTEDFEKVFP